MRYQLIAVDLDGTLLDSNNKISLANLYALKKAKKQGCYIVFCSARPLNNLIHLLIDYQLEKYVDYLVGMNGIVIECQHSKIDLWREPIRIEEIEFLYQKLNFFGCKYHFFSTTKILYFDDIPSSYTYHEAKLFNIPLEQITKNQLRNQKIYKISVVGSATELEKKIPSLLSTIKGFQMVRTAKNYFEIFPISVSKGKALSYIANKENINPQNIIAIGDQENDISMIEFAGLGVAMGNATNKLKLKADLVTTTNDQNGVSQVIETYLFD